MKISLALLLLIVCGCGPYTRAQIDLVTQARRGLAEVAKQDESRRHIADELAKLRRQRLDEAFDSDVLARPDLDADWVIEARKAYAVALDAYAAQKRADDTAADIAARNLQAIDAALARLEWLQSIQLKFSLPQEQP